ncbi:hypothetical protein AKJ51_02870 [candidate division MSBL1 archaeon SCGC-AAA382A20]|uniref:Integrase catalytic domain-containing protein n=1 Tax=candidate division MSBL1 archaeon SCGC-AAA382A20 TaxID=1698280 RepID=A0A133VK06_9EURY|nr:hypothetical protein AKJ51_02870 [candidate division MSBL1 archaeon SCGC-AAA382A20]
MFEVMYTDFTVFEYTNGHQTAMLMAIIGQISKMIFGWALETQRHRNVACRAWEQARKTFDRLGVDCVGMIMHHDQDSVYKSDLWVNQLLLEDGVRLSYSTNGAKGNTYMESFNGHFKGPIQSILNEAETIEEGGQEAKRGSITRRIQKSAVQNPDPARRGQGKEDTKRPPQKRGDGRHP